MFDKNKFARRSHDGAGMILQELVPRKILARIVGYFFSWVDISVLIGALLDDVWRTDKYVFSDQKCHVKKCQLAINLGPKGPQSKTISVLRWNQNEFGRCPGGSSEKLSQSDETDVS